MSIVTLSAYMAWLDYKPANQMHWVVPVAGMAFDLIAFVIWKLV